MYFDTKDVSLIWKFIYNIPGYHQIDGKTIKPNIDSTIPHDYVAELEFYSKYSWDMFLKGGAEEYYRTKMQEIKEKGDFTILYPKYHQPQYDEMIGYD